MVEVNRLTTTATMHWKFLTGRPAPTAGHRLGLRVATGSRSGW